MNEIVRAERALREAAIKLHTASSKEKPAARKRVLQEAERVGALWVAPRAGSLDDLARALDEAAAEHAARVDALPTTPSKPKRAKKRG